MTDAEILERWGEAIHATLLTLRSNRAREIRGDRRVRTFDARGLHPPSLEWGRVLALEELLPGLAELRDIGEPECHFLSLGRLARSEAQAAFETEIREQKEDVWA